MINVSKGMGGNRIVPSRSVLCPAGDPELTRAEEFSLRLTILRCALRAVGTDIGEARVFEW